MGNMFKKSLNVYDAWFGFYGDFKKGTFGLPYEHGRFKWVKKLVKDILIAAETVEELVHVLYQVLQHCADNNIFLARRSYRN